MKPGEYQYPGKELEIFSQATNWKVYISKVLQPFIKGDVLEAGAGIGSNTKLLNNGTADSWLMLEPDPGHCIILRQKLSINILPPNSTLQEGIISNLPGGKKFDTILYIDVMEHIEDDKTEILNAAGKLKAGGHIIILSPAHQFLFSEFDKAIGHYRRYNKQMLRSRVDGILRETSIKYYDSIGLCASITNKLLLRQSYPTRAQIYVWDRYMVTCSKFIDPLFLNKIGKTVIGIWTKK